MWIDMNNLFKIKKVFLGGTCNDSKWRDDLIKMLKINYFNPVVDDWNEDSYQREEREKSTSDFRLYVITPKLTGVYSIAEVVDDSNKFPLKTVLCVLTKDGDLKFDKSQLKSLNRVKDMVSNNGGKVCNSLKEVAVYLNNK